ncbi:unnamed protein product [Amoebophrya sp. A25]|nr:unnamed protein product [Amoebophrya sp. A25]|eukprot:GSA25T00013153001.1
MQELNFIFLWHICKLIFLLLFRSPPSHLEIPNNYKFKNNDDDVLGGSDFKPQTRSGTRTTLAEATADTATELVASMHNSPRHRRSIACALFSCRLTTKNRSLRTSIYLARTTWVATF